LRVSVRITFLHGTLNGFDVLGCDLSCANLNAKFREKIWVRAGPELRLEEGSAMIIRKTLYGIKLAGKSSKTTLVESFKHLDGSKLSQILMSTGGKQTSHVEIDTTSSY